jgi:hypothetical protein
VDDEGEGLERLGDVEEDLGEEGDGFVGDGESAMTSIQIGISAV